jgi:phosphate/sulfate permease
MQDVVAKRRSRREAGPDHEAEVDRGVLRRDGGGGPPPLAVRWGIAGRIVWAWLITIPVAALIAAAAYYILSMFGCH